MEKNHRETKFFFIVFSGQVPQLLSGRYRVVTEMGRSLFLKAGTSLTRVEHVKVTPEILHTVE